VGCRGEGASETSGGFWLRLWLCYLDCGCGCAILKADSTSAPEGGGRAISEADIHAREDQKGCSSCRTATRTLLHQCSLP